MEKAIISLVSPAGLPPERFRNQLQYAIEHLSLIFIIKDYVVYSENPPPQLLAEKFVLGCNDSDSTLILPICGGNMIYKTLNFIDFASIFGNKKIFCGTSEIGALNIFLSNLTKLQVYDGPHISFLHSKSSRPLNQFTINSFWNNLLNIDSGKKFIKRNNERYCLYQKSQNLYRNIYSEPDRVSPQNRDVVFVKRNVLIEGNSLPISLEALYKIFSLGYEFDLSKKIIITDTLDKSPKEIINIFDFLRSNLSKTNGIIFTANERSDRKKILFKSLKDPQFLESFVSKISTLCDTDIAYGFPYGHSKYSFTLPFNQDISYNERVMTPK